MKQILFVEDDEMIASGLIYALEQEDYEVIHCKSVNEALRVLQNNKFDLAILDMQLRDGSGFDVGEKLKNTDIAIIFLTVVDDEWNIVRAFESGADDYITKPFRLRELLARVKRTLNTYGGVERSSFLTRKRDNRYSSRKGIYATSIDYDASAKTTRRFFAAVQNKMHYSIHGETAAEVIYNLANSNKEHMGLTSWNGSPDSKIHKSDVVIAKNYLSEDELGQLARIVSAYLDIAELQAMRYIPMTMEDWEKRLNGFLTLMDREVLQDSGKVSAELAKAHAESEFEKYRIIQDRLYESDFDRFLELEQDIKIEK